MSSITFIIKKNPQLWLCITYKRETTPTVFGIIKLTSVYYIQLQKWNRTNTVRAPCVAPQSHCLLLPNIYEPKQYTPKFVTLCEWNHTLSSLTTCFFAPHYVL